MYKTYFETVIGIIEIICDDKYLLSIDITDESKQDQSNDICLIVKKQLEEYFNKKRKVFNLPIKLEGTDFQKKVWQELLNVSYGVTISYQELANRIKNPKGVRAVANSVGANKLLIVVPCHRIIGTDKSLTGFGGGLENKIKLLEIEGYKINIMNNLKKSLIIKP